MSAITKAQLEQASVDAGLLETFIHGTSIETIPTEEGPKPTIAGIVKQALTASSIVTLQAVTFTTGATINYNNEALLDTTSGEYYRWDGVIPAGGLIVPPNSTPSPIASGGWLSVGDSSLRSQLKDPDGATKYPEFQLARWRDEGDVRGWGSGEAGFNAAMAEKSANGGGVLYVKENITFTAIPIMHLPKVTVRWEAVAKVKSGLTADYAYIMDGGADTPIYDNTDHFTRANKTNCYNLFLIAENYLTGINSKALCVRHCYGWEYTGGALIGFNNGGIYETNNYEGKASRFTLLVANTRLDNSIGFESNSTDSWFSEFSPVGYSTGAKFNKSGNSLDKFHPWGNTVDNRVGAMGKMNVGLIVTENAGFSNYSNIILDTPVRKNINNPPSRTNGGVGIINDAWDTTFNNILIIPSKNDVVAKSTLPMITTGQKNNIKDLSVSDANFVTNTWISFENSSGFARNDIYGYGYAQYMRSGGDIGTSSGAALAPATGVTIAQQTLASGINGNTLTFSITTTIAALTSATSDVIMNISASYGVTSGFCGFVKGGMDAFFYATANAGNQLNSVSVEIVSDNTAKFLLTFVNGSVRYAKWTDVSNATAKSISISGKIEIK